jgi:fumarate hydratase class II
VVAEALKTADGKLDQHFVLDIFRTGSGASGNAAEVIVPSVTFLAE